MEAQLDKKQLEELLEKCRVKNEDEMVLEKYSRQDETKIRVCLGGLENFNKESILKKDF